jgi:hypothetical protein
MKTYIIREVHFEYDDSHYYADGFHEKSTLVFDDEQKAHQAYIELERKAFQEQTYLSGFERDRPTEGEHPYEKLAYFYEKTFGLKFDAAQPEIPTQATFEQVNYIVTLYGLRFYHLTVFEGKAVFYKITTPEPHWEHRDALAKPYNTYQEAERAALSLFVDDVESGYWATLEDLSEAPIMLEAYIKNCHWLEYTREKDVPVLRFKETWQGSLWGNMTNRQQWEEAIVEARGLLPFLREKPFQIKEKSYGQN